MNHSRSLAVLLSLSLVAPMAAQVPDGWRTAAGVTVAAGRPCAIGPDYRVRFDEHGASFTPALGRRAASERTMHCRLESIRRGTTTWLQRDANDTTMHHDDRRVTYTHRGDVREVWEARPDGVEQTFVFAERPTGSGDLVVRSHLTTDLPLATACERDGLRFFADGVGGVTIGGVTGVDANGARAAGSVRHGDGFVEFELPAAFVDGARYPLVLDPLIATAFPVGDLPGIDRLPSVSFDATTQRWLVAWVVETSISDSELRGQLLNAAGAPIFGVTLLAPWATNISEPPTVVNVNAMDRFLVVWGTRQVQVMSVYCTAVSATTGGISSPVPIMQGFTSYQTQLAAGGDARVVGDKVLVAYTEVAGSSERLRYTLVQVPAGGDPVVGPLLTLETNSTTPTVFGDVAISRSCGTAGRWLVCYRRFKDVRCVAISEVGTFCSPVTTLYTAGLFNGIRDVRCATKDGTGFAVAWHETSLLAPQRLRAMPVNVVGVCPATLSPGAIVTAVADTGGADRFAFDFARDGYVAAWAQVTGGSQQVFVRSLDPATCVDCGTSHAVEPTIAAQDEPAFASRWSSGDTSSDEGLVVWTDGTIRARRFETHGTGAVVDLGGNCGPAGNVAGHVGAPVLGDATFALTLSSPSAPVLGAIVGLSNVSAPCGPCTFVPSLDIVFGGPGPHAIPLPCDVTWLGVQFWAQWLVLAPGGCPLLPEFSFSNAQRFTIGE